MGYVQKLCLRWIKLQAKPQFLIFLLSIIFLIGMVLLASLGSCFVQNICYLLRMLRLSKFNESYTFYLA